jgi:hypothetical protein
MDTLASRLEYVPATTTEQQLCSNYLRISPLPMATLVDAGETTGQRTSWLLPVWRKLEGLAEGHIYGAGSFVTQVILHYLRSH